MWDYDDSMGKAELDLVGYDVEATDGGIGKIDEASNQAGPHTSWSTQDSGSLARSG
jgi:hypothetical protein